MPLWEEFQNNLTAFALTAAGVGAVVSLFYFALRARPLLPLQRLRKGKWTGGEVWLAFILFMLVPGFVRGLLDYLGFFHILFEKDISPIRQEIWAALLSTPLTLALLFPQLFMVSGTRPANLGLSPVRGAHNTVLGYLAFVVTAPVVLTLYFVTLLFSREVLQLAPPETHPLEALSKEPLMPVEWGLIFFRAAIAAAILEEVFFRGVLQGWLRRASFAGHATLIVCTLALGLLAYVDTLTGADRPGNQPAREPNAGPLCFALVLALGYGCALYRVWSPVLWEGGKFFFPEEKERKAQAEEIAEETGFSEVILPPSTPIRGAHDASARERWRAWEMKNAALAAFGSAMIFAAFHSSVWPSPIPLFALGLVLGRLVYRTQSLFAGIILHSLFNTVACIVLIITR